MLTNRTKRTRAYKAQGLDPVVLDQILTTKLIPPPMGTELPDEELIALWHKHGRELMRDYNCRVPLDVWGEPRG
mgnify:FL=1